MIKNKIEKNVTIKNKKASFNYEFLEKYTAGLVLKGSEIKSIRQSNASLQEAYCLVKSDEVWVTKMHIAAYEQATHFNHNPLRDRKLLLEKREIKKIIEHSKDKGLTIVPVKLFINSRGLAKLEIAIAKGKKLHDKRHTIKEKDTKRELQRQKLTN